MIETLEHFERAEEALTKVKRFLLETQHTPTPEALEKMDEVVESSPEPEEIAQVPVYSV
jgi:hypothetical protein